MRQLQPFLWLEGQYGCPREHGGKGIVVLSAVRQAILGDRLADSGNAVFLDFYINLNGFCGSSGRKPRSLGALASLGWRRLSRPERAGLNTIVQDRSHATSSANRHANVAIRQIPAVRLVYPFSVHRDEHSTHHKHVEDCDTDHDRPSVTILGLPDQLAFWGAAFWVQVTKFCAICVIS